MLWKDPDNSARQKLPSHIHHLGPRALALAALGWALANDDRAQRLLALTGLTGDALREGLGDRAVLAAVLEFLCAHEPDLLAAAEHLGVAPQGRRSPLPRELGA